ncbi:MAG: M28 family peptidase [Chitinophagales bacterium]|nr:M28 family peptidase [Chitinophagales bacterium]
MIGLISEIIERHGPRPAGSEAEKNAQRFMEEKCKEFTTDVRYLEFEEYLDARFGKLKYYVALYFASLVFYWVSIEIALVLSAVNVLFLILDLMMYRDVLTKFPGKKQTSANVEATLEPQGEVKQTIILSGHMDSTREYTWWYKLGEWGIKLTVLAGVLMGLQLAFNIAAFVLDFSYSNYLWWAFLIFSPVLIVYWDMHADDAVPGAQDNLSGISIAYHIFKNFAHPAQRGKSTLLHTRLRFLSFGSEERGLCGSRNYAKTNKQRLKKENAYLINIDGVRLVKEIAVVEHELMNGTKHHPELITGLKKSFKSLSIPLKSAMVPIGGTDAVSFARVGIPTVTIIGMSAKEYDFTYHTRHDVVENIEPESLEYVKAGVMAYIESADKS